MSGSLDVQWIHGSSDCATNDDPPLQVHAFDEDTYILRQNKCHNFEAPFLYLLFGTEKALLLDTGDDPGPDRELPLRSVPPSSTFHPGEHVLQLFPRHLAELHATLERLGDVPERTVLDDFIIEPIGS